MEFLVFFLLSVGIATARIPGSSSEYYPDAPPLPPAELPEPAINIHVPGTKQIDEVCGACFNPYTNSDCGKCAEGLQCVEDPQSALLPDLPSRCRLTSVTLLSREEGDECELFLGPSFRFDSASCGTGLECFLQPDGPATCQLAMPPLPTDHTCRRDGQHCGSKGSLTVRPVAKGGNKVAKSLDTTSYGDCCAGSTCMQFPSDRPSPPIRTCVKELSQIKQKGEICGQCFDLASNFTSCGTCAHGLECTKNPSSAILPDAGSKCQIKSELPKIKQKGEVCGRCFNMANSFNCGTCAPGLECTKNPTSVILPDAGSKCQNKSAPKCKDKKARKCKKLQRSKSKMNCEKNWTKKNCKLTCGLCKCKDNRPRKCKKIQRSKSKRRCAKNWPKRHCKLTCGLCKASSSKLKQIAERIVDNSGHAKPLTSSWPNELKLRKIENDDEDKKFQEDDLDDEEDEDEEEDDVYDDYDEDDEDEKNKTD